MHKRILSYVFDVQKLLYTPMIRHNKNILTYSYLKQTRQLCTKSDARKELFNLEEQKNNDEYNLSPGIDSRYKVFDDTDAQIILDVDEEKKRIDLEELHKQDLEARDPYEGLNMNHGINGVFEIDDLVMVLKRDNARNIFVVSVPQEYSYVDYIVFVTGRSRKHLMGLATLVRKMYKLKRYESDPIPRMEGKDSSEWIALDLGNIALHILSTDAREQYDLETLWAIGSQFDDQTKKAYEMPDIMEQYNAFLSQMHPKQS